MGNRTVLRQTKSSKQPLSNVYAILLTIAVTLCVLYLGGCKTKKNELPFDTVDQDTGLGWGLSKDKEPRLVILTNPEEIAVLDEVISQPTEVVFEDSGKTLPYHEWRLQEMDWDACFVVIAFQGWKAAGGYGVTVKSITQRGQRIDVQAEFKERESYKNLTGSVTYPVHVVKVGKGEHLEGREFQFNLVVDGKTVATKSHVIP